MRCARRAGHWRTHRVRQARRDQSRRALKTISSQLSGRQDVVRLRVLQFVSGMAPVSAKQAKVETSAGTVFCHAYLHTRGLEHQLSGLVSPVSDHLSMAWLLCTEGKRVLVTDLNSTNGTFIEEEEIEAMVPNDLHLGAEVIFGACHWCCHTTDV